MSSRTLSKKTFLHAAFFQPGLRKARAFFLFTVFIALFVVRSFGQGDYGLCPACMQDCQSYVLTPTRDDNYMNGISTFDLVLMSKHILGITPLGSPYKIIAADINKSNSVTTFDIVELRKLILGIYSDLPNNTSWRFVEKSFVFDHLSNPFLDAFTETAPIDFSSASSFEVNFIGIKVGDLNNSVIANRPAERPEYTIDFSLPETARSGDVLTIPVRYTGTEPLQAFQMALRFDPARMQLLSPSTGDLPGYNAGNFGLTDVQTGVIRTLWFADFNDPDQRIEPGAVLFYLSFQMLKKGPASLALDPNALPCLAWKLDDTECTLRGESDGERSTSPATGSLQASCRPNPTSGEVVFSVETEQAGKGRIALFGPYGNRVWVRDMPLNSGKQDIPVSDIAGLPAGVYVWKVYAGGKKVQGHLIKQ